MSLLMTPGTPVPHEVLIDRLWGEDPPAKARDDLRAYASRLNRCLRQAADDETRLVSQSHGYALIIDPQSVDLHQFRLFGRQAESMALSGDDEQAAALLRAGDALWRGQALTGLPGDWISRMRASLEEERRIAIVKRIDLELRLGHHIELARELRELADRYPLDEAFLSQQMTALYRAGRQADALRAYREARDRLVDQGIEPTPGLTKLHQAILRHDPELAITPVFRRPGRASQPDTLPPGIGSFVGRADEIRQITRQSDRANEPIIQVIEGMPGVGKTTLAIQVAHQMAGRYPDARLFLDCRGHAPGQVPLQAAEALYRLLQMLDVPAARIPGDVRERANLWQAELAHRRMIIVLDDVCDIEEIRPVLPVAGDNLTIVTSRRRHARREGASSRVLDVLPIDDAIELFAQVSGGQVGEADQMARAVTMCGCLPLAIWVSASWLRHGNLSGVSELLDELSRLAGEQDLTGSLGEQLMPAFEMSYQRLTHSQRDIFRYLGISPCPETSLHAAMALTGQERDITQNALRTLLDCHLLAEFTPGRFRFHDIIRVYAAFCSAREDSESDRRSAIGRLLRYYLSTARKANEMVFALDSQNPASGDSDGQASAAVATLSDAREWLQREWRNILLAARYATRHEWKRQCAGLTDALAEFLEANGHWDEAVEAQGLALQACRGLGDHSGAAHAALRLSMAELLTGHQDAALDHANEAVELFRRLGDRNGEAAALDRIGIICYQSARFRDSIAYHQESADIYRGTGDLRGMALALCHTGVAYTSLGRFTEAFTSLDQALTLYRRVGDKRGEAITLNNIGSAQDDQGYYRDAMRKYEESLSIFQEIDELQDNAVLEQNIGRIHQYRGDYDKALASYRSALTTYRSIGDLRLQAYALCDIGSAYQGKEYYSEALAHHEKAQSIAQRIGERYVCVKALCGIAEARQGSGRYNAALDVFQEALRRAREIESPALEAKALQGMGDTLLHTKGVESARIYWRQALDIFRQMGVPEATTLEIRLEALSESA